ncbi:MAG: histidine phosphatase family protein [Geobacteraceae bacterium]|nr:histidine phosphatase family protein [Geobacteraceae bacterium]
MQKTITLARHASIDLQFDGHYIGRTDVSLSAYGVFQAQELVRKLKRSDKPAIDAVWCSPARRARQTAAPLAVQQDCSVSIKEELQEIDFGAWEGLTFNQILRNDPQRVNQWAAFAEDFSFPAGESLRQFSQRLNAVAEAIHAQASAHLVIVSHGGVLRGLICNLMDWPLRDHLKFTIERGGYATLRVDEHHAVLTGLYNHDD